MLIVKDLIREALSRRSVITIGAYDGVHRGHQEVIRQVRELAERLDCMSVVVTFDRHPASVVRPESAPKLLTDAEQKLELLAATGIDATCIVNFTKEEAMSPPEEFVRRVMADALKTKVIVVGEDFHFGHRRSGNVETLREFGKTYDFSVEPIRLVPRPDGVNEPVSSTAIRRALAGGQVEVARQLLGHPFEIRGEVIQGDRRGRELGFPTANIAVHETMCMPADGVYAGWFVTESGDRYRAAINFGRRPTFVEHATHSLLEAHLLEFSGDLYGQRAKVTFEHFLRSERKFDGLESLKRQLQDDVVAARSALA